ncbi:MAG: DUF6497 family protein [Rhodobacter sp.]|nr:DUF6497 family protein [Rhodobacter sp.]
MRRLAALAAILAGPAAAQTVAVPSGQTVTLTEVIRDVPGPGGIAYRYRFVAPGIARNGGGIDATTAAADIDALCRDVVLPDLAGGVRPDQVIISLSDRPVPFGQPAPDATQFFESYRIEDGACIWEEF